MTASFRVTSAYFPLAYVPTQPPQDGWAAFLQLLRIPAVRPIFIHAPSAPFVPISVQFAAHRIESLVWLSVTKQSVQEKTCYSTTITVVPLHWDAIVPPRYTVIDMPAKGPPGVCVSVTHTAGKTSYSADMATARESRRTVPDSSDCRCAFALSSVMGLGSSSVHAHTFVFRSMCSDGLYIALPADHLTRITAAPEPTPRTLSAEPKSFMMAALGAYFGASGFCVPSITKEVSASPVKSSPKPTDPAAHRVINYTSGTDHAVADALKQHAHIDPRRVALLMSDCFSLNMWVVHYKNSCHYYSAPSSAVYHTLVEEPTHKHTADSIGGPTNISPRSELIGEYLRDAPRYAHIDIDVVVSRYARERSLRHQNAMVSYAKLLFNHAHRHFYNHNIHGGWVSFCASGVVDGLYHITFRLVNRLVRYTSVFPLRKIHEYMKWCLQTNRDKFREHRAHLLYGSHFALTAAAYRSHIDVPVPLSVGEHGYTFNFHEEGTDAAMAVFIRRDTDTQFRVFQMGLLLGTCYNDELGTRTIDESPIHTPHHALHPTCENILLGLVAECVRKSTQEYPPLYSCDMQISVEGRGIRITVGNERTRIKCAACRRVHHRTLDTAFVLIRRSAICVLAQTCKKRPKQTPIALLPHTLISALTHISSF